MEPTVANFNLLSNIMVVVAIIIGVLWKRLPMTGLGKWILFGVAFSLSVGFKLAARAAAGT
jgi:hypothetical protein